MQPKKLVHCAANIFLDANKRGDGGAVQATTMTNLQQVKVSSGLVYPPVEFPGNFQV